MGRLRDEQVISVPSRRSRVASCFALITQKVLIRRYHGGCC
jgi:hypothetical protein